MQKINTFTRADFIGPNGMYPRDASKMSLSHSDGASKMSSARLDVTLNYSKNDNTFSTFQSWFTDLASTAYRPTGVGALPRKFK